MENNKVKENMYRLLYRFLRENYILGNYVNNVIRIHHTVGNAKAVLQSLIDRYYLTEGRFACPNLFNWAPTAFFWSDSIEGAEFWRYYHSRWSNFYNKHKEEYGFN
jgi:hypothetical protein